MLHPVVTPDPHRTVTGIHIDGKTSTTAEAQQFISVCVILIGSISTGHPNPVMDPVHPHTGRRDIQVYVEELFKNKNNLIRLVNRSDESPLPVIGTKLGKILGHESYIKEAIKKFERRKKSVSLERKRVNDIYFEPVGKIVMEIERKHKTKIDQIDTTTYLGKRIRGELLLHLRDKGGLKYNEIIKMDLFSDLKLHSLGKLYNRARMKYNKK